MTRVPPLAKMPSIDLAARVKALEVTVGEQQQELTLLRTRMIRADQKIVKLKAKARKKRGELWPGLDHIADFINALDSEGMTARDVRKAIYTECITPTEHKGEDE